MATWGRRKVVAAAAVTAAVGTPAVVANYEASNPNDEIVYDLAYQVEGPPPLLPGQLDKSACANIDINAGEACVCSTVRPDGVIGCVLLVNPPPGVPTAAQLLDEGELDLGAP